MPLLGPDGRPIIRRRNFVPPEDNLNYRHEFQLKRAMKSIHRIMVFVSIFPVECKCGEEVHSEKFLIAMEARNRTGEVVSGGPIEIKRNKAPEGTDAEDPGDPDSGDSGDAAVVNGEDR